MKTLFHTSRKSWFLLVLIVIVGTLAIQGGPYATGVPAIDAGQLNCRVMPVLTTEISV
jgi:hypothetical protein